MADNRTANIPENEAKQSRGLGSYVVWAFVVVMVYVLSSGPAFRYVVRSPRSAKLHLWYYYSIVYQPLQWAYRYTPLSWPLGTYWHLWAPESGYNFLY